MGKGNPAIRVPEPLIPVVRLIIEKYNAKVSKTQAQVADDILEKLEAMNDG